MSGMDMGTTKSRSPITPRMAWILVSLLFGLGTWLIGQGAWIHVKAVTAQWLLQQAWQATLIDQKPVKPWPWADTGPVGQLVIPHLGINQIILADASGQSLAFGPGIVRHRKALGEHSMSLILSGHRDTHFSFVQDIRLGDAIQLQTLQGTWHRFIVNSTDVRDSRTDLLPTTEEESNLRLITCYPFDAVLPGGPLRYVVGARLKAQRVVTQTEASASSAGGSRGRGMMMEGG